MKQAMALDSPRQIEPATYQDVLDAPPNMVAEIINGVLYTQARPAPPHIHAGTKLTIGIGRYFDDDDGGGPGGWRILAEPELHLGGDVIVPDLAGWRMERMPELPETAYFEVAPDWVCEILSPSTRKMDLMEKRPIYAREGVGHLWLVDPVARTLEAFELRNGEWVLIATLADDDDVKVRPFDAVTMKLSKFWP